MAIKIPNYLYSVNADGTVAFADQLTDKDFITSHANEMNIDISNEDIYARYSKQNEINKFLYNKFDNYVPTNDVPNLTITSSSYAATASYVDGLDDKLESIKSSDTITLREQDFSAGGVAKIYTIYQGGKEINGVSTINIERSKYTTGGELVTKDDGLLYLKLFFNSEDDYVEIPVNKLIEIYKGYNTDTISIEINDSNYIIATIRDESITDSHISPNANISLSKIDLSDLHTYITGSSNLASTTQGVIDLSFGDGIDIAQSSVNITGLTPVDNPTFNEITANKFVTTNGTSTSLVTGTGTLVDIEDTLSKSATIQGITQSFAQTTNDMMMQITNLSNFVYSLYYTASFTAQPSIIFAGNDTEVTLTATLMFNGQPTSDFTATTPDGATATITEGYYRTFSIQPNSSTTYTTTLKSTSSDYSTTKTATVDVVYPIYYGQSPNVISNEDDAVAIFNTMTQSLVPTLSAQDTTYTIEMEQNNYFYIAVPTTLIQPSQIGITGYSGTFDNMVPCDMGCEFGGVMYNFYRTQTFQDIDKLITYYII